MSVEVFQPTELPDLLGTSPADLVPEDLVERGAIPQATEEEARERANWIRSNLPTYVEVRSKIAEARARRDWLALGYPTWFAYVSEEFDPANWNLDRKTRRELVAESLKADPALSDAAHATRTGATDKTIAKVRRELEATSEIPRLESRVGDDGKARRAPENPAVPNPPPSVNGGSTEVKSSAPPAAPASNPDKPAPEKPEKSGDPPRPEDRPGYWSPEDRKAHEEEVQLQKDRESARTYAANIVTQIRTYTVTVITGYRLGEHNLVTLEQIADMRKAIDNLEKEVIADAQR